MKNLLYILLIFALIGCKKEKEKQNDDGWLSAIPGGGYFIMANTIRLYYIDENSNGIIKPDKSETLPYTYWNGIKPSVIKIPEDYKGGLYNGNRNSLTYDPEEKLYYGSTYLQGDKSKANYTFYISCAGELDRFDVNYSYKPGEAIGGDGIGVRMDQLRINNVVVANDENKFDRKIFIKKVNGKTIISNSR
jgi:hypothetical protein